MPEFKKSYPITWTDEKAKNGTIYDDSLQKFLNGEIKAVKIVGSKADGYPTRGWINIWQEKKE